MDILSYIKKEIVKKAYKYGLILTPEALDYILFSVKDVDGVLRDLSRRGITTVRLEDVVSPLEKESGEEKRADEAGEPVNKVLLEPKECENRIRIRLYVDPGEIYPSSWERDREKILRERLENISSILLSKGHVSFVSYDRARRSEEQRYVLSLILKIDVTPSGRTVLYVENEEESATVVYVPARDMDKKVRYLDEDEVVALGVRGKDEKLFLTDVVYPALSGYTPANDPCPYRLLVVPNLSVVKRLDTLPIDDVDGVLFLSNVVNVYRETDLRAAYRRVDELISKIEKDVFVVPGPYDAVRFVPPHPPIDDSLLPDAASVDNVHVLGSPAVVRINRTTLLFYDGYYYLSTGRPLDEIIMSRLVQPNISSFPYLSSRDYSFLKRVPDLVLSPVGGNVKSIGDVLIVPLTHPYVVDISSKKVIELEKG